MNVPYNLSLTYFWRLFTQTWFFSCSCCLFATATNIELLVSSVFLDRCQLISSLFHERLLIGTYLRFLLCELVVHDWGRVSAILAFGSPKKSSFDYCRTSLRHGLTSLWYRLPSKSKLAVNNSPHFNAGRARTSAEIPSIINTTEQRLCTAIRHLTDNLVISNSRKTTTESRRLERAEGGCLSLVNWMFKK